MKVLIDGDGCPVIDIAVRLCRQYRIPCLILCDTAHTLLRDGAETLVFDKGADSVDYALVKRVEAGDLVITQDYGLASMCLSRNAFVMHQDGWEYTPWNIDALLFQRYDSGRMRAAGKRSKGPSKRTAQQDHSFETALIHKLKTMSTDMHPEVPL